MPCSLAITSMSLGWASAGHHIEHKLDVAHEYGYKGIELFWDDLRDLALRKFKSTAQDYKLTDPASEPSQEAQLAAARHIRRLCDKLDIFIICLQPFVGYEGHKSASVRKALIDKLAFWFLLTDALRTDMIQIPSSYVPEDDCYNDADMIISDLRGIADMGARRRRPLRFVYEALCFGTRVDQWETSWEIVKRVDRDNFGLCLDSFNIAARIYADPAAHYNGFKTVDAMLAVQRSIARMQAGDLDMRKVFYVQIVDGERLTKPLSEQEYYDPSLVPRMNWSRNCRLFYGEQDRGGYLPIKEIAETIFKTLGYEGWVSLELFNRRMRDADDKVPEELARRGAISWAKLVRDLNLATKYPPMSISEASSLAGEESSVADEASSPERETDQPSDGSEDLDDD